MKCPNCNNTKFAQMSGFKKIDNGFPEIPQMLKIGVICCKCHITLDLYYKFDKSTY